MTINIILRHWKFSEDSWFLTEDWKNNSIEKWKEILKITSNISSELIQIISSNSLRAIETAEGIKKWLWIDNEILKTDILSEYSNKLKEIKWFVENLPPHLLLLIITHWPNVYPISAILWYKWDYNPIKLLWWYNFKT